MSKRKPDELIEYRISLHDKERQLLDQVSTAYSVNKIATPLVNLLSDASAMALVVAFLYSIFNKSGDMEGADPLLFKAITDPTNFFQNFTLWYVTKRKKIIQEGEVTPEQLEAMEGLFVSNLPGLGPIFRLFN